MVILFFLFSGMKKYETSQMASNFSKQMKSQAILFYSQSSYLMNNFKINYDVD